jgi:serine-type D-Ala-D-Ala endopeptidase (penicillin-binding protein 7)
VHRLIAVLVALSLPVGAEAAAPSRHKEKAAIVESQGAVEPKLQSSQVLVFDPASGQTLYAKNADQATPIASITKLMTAMVVIDANLPLDEVIEITADDVDRIKNTTSRLPLGSHFRRDDLLRLALMASDNRAASALGRNYPGGLPAFVDAMNAKAKLLGLQHTHYVDSSGLSPNNVSSASDLGRLVANANEYPLIREYSTTSAVEVQLPDSRRKLSFVNTNALVRNSDWKIGLSKTGYISEAGKCLVMHAMIANQPIVIVLLDSWGRLTRVGDANRIRRWIESNPKLLAATPLRGG